MSDLRPDAPTLSYHASEEPSSPGKRPRWVWVVLSIYLLLIGTMLTSPAWAALLGSDASAIVYLSVYVSVLIGSGLALLIAPVRRRRLRPMTRRSIWFPIIASALLIALLCLGAALAVGELFRVESAPWIILGATVLIWVAWAALFAMLSMRGDFTSFGATLHRKVLVGSALELLIAVPAHVIVRRRDECCAGYLTGMGICVGVTVMLVAFGPSVFVLYYKRWQKLSR